MKTRLFLSPVAIQCAILFSQCLIRSANGVDYQRDIRPILAANCFACHGPDEEAREADLRLDDATGASIDRGGYKAIEPGQREQSELWIRVTTDDLETRMPPSGSHSALSDVQIEKLGQWIDEGAIYAKHWAFELPHPSPLSNLAHREHASGPIDVIIQSRLEQAGLNASPEADRYSLVRRLYLDLVGIPPTPDEADRFILDTSPIAYERLVDSLLASPDYAERWARPWLDLARYADTNGYEKDRPRTIWPYRDWVLDAIGADMPFDEFSIRQLAGDMLPNATHRDRIATGFHRNTMLNEEGGIDPLEYRFHAMTDRVATTGLTWMGLTTGCAQCHTHKYDPITHVDYYAMFGLLNNADEPELDADEGSVSKGRMHLEADIRSQEDAWIDENITSEKARAAVNGQGSALALFNEWLETTAKQASNWTVLIPDTMESSSPSLRLLDDGSVLASGDVTKRETYYFRFESRDGSGIPKRITAIRLEALPHPTLPANGPGMAYYEGRRGDFFLSHFRLVQDKQNIKLINASQSFGKISIGSGTADASNVIDQDHSTGWSTAGAEGTPNSIVLNLEAPIAFDTPLEITLLFERHFAAALGRLRVSVTDRNGMAAALPIDSELERDLVKSGFDRGEAVNLREYARRFLQTADCMKETYAPIEKQRQQLPESVRTLVMQERTENPRTTRRHHRGEYLQPREVVRPGILQIFLPLTNTLPTNRLEFAKWLVSDRNPMVGRVTVDRAWRELFGRAIVHSAGDYGTQSPAPSHPELLDYLSHDLVKSGWSIKRLHREIVNSAAYKRASHHRPEVTSVDPENRLLAIGPRRRLEAERIRDAMLAASGLLHRRRGGPSVYPPQPQSVTNLAYGNTPWPTSQGGDRYRRSVYTYAKRTAPFAAYTVYDGPTGELCLPRRDSSSSPLQSLTLMNDEMYVELAESMVAETLRSAVEPTDAQVISILFRRLMTRPPTDDELEAILAFYRNPEQQASGAKSKDFVWVLVARALMNLDEAITTP